MPLALLLPRFVLAALLSVFSARASASVSPVSAADEWPMFRGNPALTGVAGGTLPDKPVLLWNFKTGGAVKSSAVIGGGKVYIGSNDGFIYALDFASGRKLWACKARGAVLAPPLLADDRVFIGDSEGFFYALNAQDGRLLWKKDTEGKIVASATLFQEAGKPARVLTGSYDFKMYCFNASDGVVAWTYETGNYINGACAIDHGRTIFGGCDSILHVLSLTDGRKEKEIDAGAYIAASVALAGDCAYFGQYENEFLCVNLKTGVVAWRYHDLDFPYMASAAVTADRVVFGGFDKQMHCLQRANGTNLWKFATRGKIESSPVVAGDEVVFGSDDGNLYALGLEDGRERWSYDLGQPVVSSPAVAARKIVMGCDDGNVYCFGQKLN